MDRKPGQIAEYGTKEFEDNKSVYTILEKGIYTNPSGMKFPCELYHRTQGYKIAGSCATWTNEVWGYKIIYPDGTITGKMFLNNEEALETWKKLPALINS